MKGIFITIEGGDGSGKSTQIELIKRYVTEHGHDVVLTREPGGTRISEAIRELVLDKSLSEMTDMTEALLYAASRAQHTETYIVPNLIAGKVVICDRYVDSSIVYQGIARGLGDSVRIINEYATNHLTPDLTILLDLSHGESMERKKGQKELDRLEMEEARFHEKVSDGYRQLAHEYPERILRIDASLPIEKIHDMIVQKLKQLID
ncbi:MAG: dTMP kinase [Vallitaleaceae bacterium]|jgi:dTMP kinase|nr:dTMP kinase [Vallitaleaceae bacterium]